MDTTTSQPEVSVCPKRGWVLSVLADDENRGPDEALPQGLRFHLARCASCRDAAERLQVVTRALDALDDGAMREGLDDDADAAALAALGKGHHPDIVPEAGETLDEVLVDRQAVRSRRLTWMRRALAAAAVISFAFLFGRAWQVGHDSASPGGAAQTDASRQAHADPDAPLPAQVQVNAEPAGPHPAAEGSTQSPGHLGGKDNGLKPALSHPDTGQAIRPPE